MPLPATLTRKAETENHHNHQFFKMKEKIIWGAIAFAVVYFYEKGKTTYPTMPVESQFYSLGYNFGKTGTFSLTQPV